jgi:hypothetical protein
MICSRVSPSGHYRMIIGEEAHWAGEPSPVVALCFAFISSSVKCREPAAGVVEKQSLAGSEYTAGNDTFHQNIVRYRGPASSDKVDFGLRQTQDSREVSRNRGSMQVTTADFGAPMLPQRPILTIVLAIPWYWGPWNRARSTLRPYRSNPYFRGKRYVRAIDS